MYSFPRHFKKFGDQKINKYTCVLSVSVTGDCRFGGFETLELPEDNGLECVLFTHVLLVSCGLFAAPAPVKEFENNSLSVHEIKRKRAIYIKMVLSR